MSPLTTIPMVNMKKIGKAERKYGIVRDLVYSPDDGGWYGEETNLDTGKRRVTKLTYPTKEALEIVLRSTFAKYRWEKWT